MAFNGAGVWTANSAGQPVVANTTISSTVFNALTADIALGLSTTICRDGQSVITANIPFSTFKITGLGPATGTNDALTYAGAGNFAGMVGTTTNDSAVAGRIGEFVETVVTSGAPVSMTSGVATAIASVTLTAGDWDVEANFVTFPSAGTVTSAIQAGINTTINTLPATERQQIHGTISTASIIASASLPRIRISVAGTTNVYLNAQATFSVSTMTGCGFINARRVR